MHKKPTNCYNIYKTPKSYVLTVLKLCISSRMGIYVCPLINHTNHFQTTSFEKNNL